jgi:hypothetical protein
VALVKLIQASDKIYQTSEYFEVFSLLKGRAKIVFKFCLISQIASVLSLKYVILIVRTSTKVGKPGSAETQAMSITITITAAGTYTRNNRESSNISDASNNTTKSRDASKHSGASNNRRVMITGVTATAEMTALVRMYS